MQSCECHGAFVKVRGQLRGFGFLFPPWGPGDQVSATRLGAKPLCQLNHLTDPRQLFKKFPNNFHNTPHFIYPFLSGQMLGLFTLGLIHIVLSCPRLIHGQPPPLTHPVKCWQPCLLQSIPDCSSHKWVTLQDHSSDSLSPSQGSD